MDGEPYVYALARSIRVMSEIAYWAFATAIPYPTTCTHTIKTALDFSKKIIGILRTRITFSAFEAPRLFHPQTSS